MRIQNEEREITIEVAQRLFYPSVAWFGPGVTLGLSVGVPDMMLLGDPFMIVTISWFGSSPYSGPWYWSKSGSRCLSRPRSGAWSKSSSRSSSMSMYMSRSGSGSESGCKYRSGFTCRGPRE